MRIITTIIIIMIIIIIIIEMSHVYLGKDAHQWVGSADPIPITMHMTLYTTEIHTPPPINVYSVY